MDLVSIVRTVWRHKLASIAVILVTVLGVFYVIKIKPAVYQASSEIILLSPPGPPSAAQIAQHPKLAKVNINNPYVAFGNLAIVADAVINSVTSSSAQQALANTGANPGYQVILSTETGFPPIIQITGTGSSSLEAIHTANLVTAAARTALYQLQMSQNVNNQYLITSAVLVRPTTAQLAVSGKIRTLVAVLALGAVLLFVVISVTEAMDKRRDQVSARSPVTAELGALSSPQNNGRPGRKALLAKVLARRDN